jgi:ribonucleoside-diphosphate reductase alpha chain
LHEIYNKETKKIDYALLKDLVKTTIRFLENVTEVSVAPIDYINEMTKGLRRLGLGVLGWADLLVELNIAYDSAEAISLANYLSWFISFHAWETSYELAKERGSFPYYQQDKINFHIIEKTLYGNKYEKSLIPFEELKKNGIRNVSVTSVAPTGSIAIIAGVNSSIEPFFALAYKRNITEGVGNIALDSLFETNPALERKLKEFNHDKETINKILEYVNSHGSLTGCELVTPEVQSVFKTANEIHWKYHVDMQAAWQEYVSNAISKTINLPEDSTVEDIYNIYIYMWEMGLKGGTVYRDNSKSFQVLEKPTKKE